MPGNAAVAGYSVAGNCNRIWEHAISTVDWEPGASGSLQPSFAECAAEGGGGELFEMCC